MTVFFILELLLLIALLVLVVVLGSGIHVGGSVAEELAASVGQYGIYGASAIFIGIAATYLLFRAYLI
jgi:hypothetical protein